MAKRENGAAGNRLAIALLVACVMFAYGFSNQNALFQWKLPLAVILATAVWTFLPRLRGPGESA